MVHREADKPAEQQVVVDLLHQLPLTADRVEGHQQLGAQELLRRDGIPTERRVERIEVGIKNGQRLVHHRADRPQWVILRHPRRRAGRAAQRVLVDIGAAHGLGYRP